MGRLIEYCKKKIAAYKLIKKRKKWTSSGRIKIDSTAIIFPETSLCASIGSISVGARTCIRGKLEIQRYNGQIVIGENCYIGDHTRIWAASNIKIGNNVLIAHNVNIFDNDTHPIDYIERREDAEEIIWNGKRKNFETLKSLPIVIDDDAWICCGCTILKGVKIGKCSIVSAGSVVTKDVPDNVIVGGNPAKILKKIEVSQNNV